MACNPLEVSEMAHDNEAEIRRLYERYKLLWMLYHDLGLVDLMDCMEVMLREDAEIPSLRSKFQDLFKAWEFGVGFPGGQMWPCFEEYRDSEYASDPSKAHLLISVCERDIQTEVHPSFEAARAAMLAELKKEFLKECSEAEWEDIESQDEFECSDLGFSKLSAWSNMDDNCYCDWKIIPIPPVIT